MSMSSCEVWVCRTKKCMQNISALADWTYCVIGKLCKNILSGSSFQHSGSDRIQKEGGGVGMVVEKCGGGERQHLNVKTKAFY